MNIVLVSHEFFLDGGNYHGGIATYMKSIAQELHRSGNHVCVITLSFDLNDAVIWDGIRVERVRMPAYAYKIKKIFHSKAGEYLIGAWLIRRRLHRLFKCWAIPDIVHYANFKSVGFFLDKRIPSVVRLSSDNVLWREAHKEFYTLESAFGKIHLEDRLEYRTIKRADGVFAPSCFLAELTKKRLQIAVKVIESPAPDPSLEEMACNLPQMLCGRQYVLYFGALSRAKGTHLFLGIIQELLRKNPICAFVFVGHDYGMYTSDGKELFSQRLKESAGQFADRLVCLDHVPPQQLYSIISHAVCCAFPSRVDNLPNTCLEAMSLGVPVIGTYGASFEQLINDGISGLLVEIDNADQLKSAILQVLEMPESERMEMGRQAKARMRSNHISRITEQLSLFYQEVINQHEQKRS